MNRDQQIVRDFYDRELVPSACRTCGARRLIEVDEFRHGVEVCVCKGGDNLIGYLCHDGWVVVSADDCGDWLVYREGFIGSTDADDIVSSLDYHDEA